MTMEVARIRVERIKALATTTPLRGVRMAHVFSVVVQMPRHATMSRLRCVTMVLVYRAVAQT